MKKREDFKYITQFSMSARCIFDGDKNKYLAEASINDLRQVLPDDVGGDLLPIAANACVVNLVNKNNDAITTATAKKIKNRFIHKPINIEHNRSEVVGHIVSAKFSKFDSNYAIGVGSDILDDVDGSKPFNICVGGYVYDVVAPGVIQQIIDSNDPNSPAYLDMSLSWELGFDNYKILLGSQLVEEGEVISDSAAIESYSKYLKAYGGSGKLDDGRGVYRLLDDVDENSEVVPLGVALTFSPAGQVRGVITSEENLPVKQDDNDSLNASEKNNIKLEEKISQQQTNTVTDIIHTMRKFTSFAEIKNLNDENVKDYSFANIAEILEQEGSRLIKEYQNKIDAEKTASFEAKAETEKALAELIAQKELIKQLQEQINKINQEHAQAEAFNKFNDRMSGLESEYELDEESRAALAGDIRNLDDEGFEKFLASFKTYNKKNKKMPMKDGDKDSKVTPPAQSKASVQQDLALDMIPGQDIPNTVQPVTSYKDKYKAAFGGDNITITN